MNKKHEKNIPEQSTTNAETLQESGTGAENTVIHGDVTIDKQPTEQPKVEESKIVSEVKTFNDNEYRDVTKADNSNDNTIISSDETGGTTSTSTELPKENKTKWQRPKGLKYKKRGEKITPEQAKIQTINNSSGIIDDANKFNQQTLDQKTQSEVSALINGAMLLMCIDFIAPGVILWLLKFVDPKYKQIKAAKIKLTKDEKKDLEPLADAVAKQLLLNISPMAAFTILITFAYGSKIMAESLDLVETK